MKYYKVKTNKGSVVIQAYQALSVNILESLVSGRGMILEGYSEIDRLSFEHKSNHTETIYYLLNEDDSMCEGSSLNE